MLSGIADQEREGALTTARVRETRLRARAEIAIIGCHRRLDQAYRRAIAELIRDSYAASAMLKTTNNQACWRVSAVYMSRRVYLSKQSGRRSGPSHMQGGPGVAGLQHGEQQ